MCCDPRALGVLEAIDRGAKEVWMPRHVCMSIIVNEFMTFNKERKSLSLTDRLRLNGATTWKPLWLPSTTRAFPA